MSPQDASFLHIEDASTHMHIGSVGIFEGPPPTYEEILAAIARKLPLVPRYRQKVRFVPLHVGQPVWVDDPHFTLEYHVRHTALPSPGGDQQLRNLVGRVIGQQLDRNRPLWEMWVAEGLDDDRWAVLTKTHHCMVDGVSATDLMSVLFDAQREPGPPAADPWRPQPEPDIARVIAHALGEQVSMMAAARAPARLAEQFVQASRGLQSFQNLLRPAPRTSLNGPIGPHRRWAWARGRLADVKTIRQGLGGTVNDAVLAAISGGFRELLLARGEKLEQQVVRTMVPVSVRAQSERGTFNNKVSAMFAELPIAVADPVERLRAVQTQMDGLKESGQAVSGEALTALSGFAPPMWLALGGRLASRVPQRNVQTVTTNVPGPQHPLFLAERRMLEAFPVVPLGGSIRIGIAIFSYDGSINYGVTGDYETAPDIDVLCRGIEQGLADLVQAAAKTARPRARRATKKPSRPAGRQGRRAAGARAGGSSNAAE